MGAFIGDGPGRSGAKAAITSNAAASRVKDMAAPSGQLRNSPNWAAIRLPSMVMRPPTRTGVTQSPQAIRNGSTNAATIPLRQRGRIWSTRIRQDEAPRSRAASSSTSPIDRIDGGQGQHRERAEKMRQRDDHCGRVVEQPCHRLVNQTEVQEQAVDDPFRAQNSPPSVDLHQIATEQCHDRPRTAEEGRNRPALKRITKA